MKVSGIDIKKIYLGLGTISAEAKKVMVGTGSSSVEAWSPAVVRLTGTTDDVSRDQLRAALVEAGTTWQTATHIPFNIDASASTNLRSLFWGMSNLQEVPYFETGHVTKFTGMFENCTKLTTIPPYDTYSATSTSYMFQNCTSLTSVPDLYTPQVTDTKYMFSGCTSLTDGKVRLIGRHPQVTTTGMIDNSSLTREPFYDADGTPDDGPTSEVHEVTLTGVNGAGTVHPLLTVTVPAGQTWNVRIQGTMTKAGINPSRLPRFRIGATTSDGYAEGAAVNFSGTISATDSTIAVVTGSTFSADRASFVGTVTIEK